MSLRVLVVDDASFVRETIKRAMRQLVPESEIFEAADGRKAMSLMKVNAIDLILSDWEMPEVSGEEFLQWVRKQPKYMDTPFLMVTSRGDRNHVITAVNAGVSDYLTKPFTAEELARKVAKQLRKIGYSSKRKTQNSTDMSSLNALTGGKPKTVDAPKKKEVKAAAAFAKPAAKKAEPKFTGNFAGKAQIRLAKSSFDCEVRELSLQAMNGHIQRGDTVPTLFEQAAVDLENAQGEALARLNGYVHAIVAQEPHPDAQTLRVTIRFVDNDPEKFEVLSKAIANS